MTLPFQREADRIGRFMRSPLNGPIDHGFCRNVKEVVVVVCSPRSGSSLLASILRRTDQLLNFQGAITPLLGLANLRYPDSGDSDALTADQADVAIANHLPAYFSQDCGTPSTTLDDDQSVGRFAVDLAIRLSMQWPGVDFDLDLVHASLREALKVLVDEHGWTAGAFEDVSLFHAVFLSRLRLRHPDLNPHLYDIDKSLLADVVPDAEPVDVMSTPRFIEMPPLITIVPWRRATQEDLASKPLVIKTVANTFRLPFLKALFRDARFRILHLTRSVAASANGMYDGWHFPGFWAARVDRPLAIPGYSDRYPWGKHWWKFGLVPGWEKMADQPIIDICAFHWRRCHETVLSWLDEHPAIEADSLRIRFEDVLGTEAQRRAVYDRMTDWLGIELDAGLAHARDNDLPLQLATAKPAPRRWRRRMDVLEPVLEDPRNRELMVRLGYDPDPQNW